MTPKWLKFNGTDVQVPDDETWSEKFGIIDTQHETEAGTTLVAVTRYGKLTASATWTVSQQRKKEFEIFAKSGEIAVQIAHDLNDSGEQITRQCILRDIKSSMIGYSGGRAYFTMSMKIQEL